MYKTKIFIFIILAITVVTAVVLNIKSNIKPKINIETLPLVTTPANETISETRNLCYYRATKTERGFYDKALLRLSITGEKITGEFQNLPAESDSKVGLFNGTMGPLDQISMSRSAIVWWDSRVEGMEVKEELEIKWGDGSATVGFGEMVDRGDGVYVYKNKSNLYYIDQMDQKDCENLDEQLLTEEYIRDNISTIATDKAVLGGSWYVISVISNSSTKTGEVTYEDGHIQSKAKFTYSYDKESKKISIAKFEIIK